MHCHQQYLLKWVHLITCEQCHVSNVIPLPDFFFHHCCHVHTSLTFHIRSRVHVLEWRRLEQIHHLFLTLFNKEPYDNMLSLSLSLSLSHTHTTQKYKKTRRAGCAIGRTYHKHVNIQLFVKSYCEATDNHKGMPILN